MEYNTQNRKEFFIQKPSEGLYRAILARIDFEKIRQARRRFVLFTTTSLVSCVGLIYALKYTVESFFASDFPQYFSLIFSDGTSILSYWKEFLFVLSESLPVAGILMLLAVFIITLLSVKHLVKDYTLISYKTV
jgi:hypothetical protein